MDRKETRHRTGGEPEHASWRMASRSHLQNPSGCERSGAFSHHCRLVRERHQDEVYGTTRSETVPSRKDNAKPSRSFGYPKQGRRWRRRDFALTVGCLVASINQ